MLGGLEQAMIEVLEKLEEGHRVIPAVRTYFQNQRTQQALRRLEQNRLAQAAHRRRKAQSSEVVMLTLANQKEMSPHTPLKKNNISTPAETISQMEDEEVLTQLTKVLSRESAIAYLHHHRQIGNPVVLETVAAHCRLLREHSNPDKAADRMVCGRWKNLPRPELLDAGPRGPSVGPQANVGQGRKGSDQAYSQASLDKPRASRGRKRGRKSPGMQAKGKRGKAAPGKDFELTQRLAIREANRKKSLLPKELVDAVPDMPLSKYRPLTQRWGDPDVADDLYNRSYERKQ